MLIITYKDIDNYMRKYFSHEYETERKMKNAVNRRFKEIDELARKPQVKSMVVKLEWKKSKTWGANPHAEVWIEDVNGHSEYKKGYSVSGCGYDKTAQILCDILNDVARQNLIHSFNNDTKSDHCLNVYWNGELGSLPMYSASGSDGNYFNYVCIHYAWGESFDEFHIEFDVTEK